MLYRNSSEHGAPRAPLPTLIHGAAHRSAGEKSVNVGFRRADVKPVVEGGILDGLDDIHDKE